MKQKVLSARARSTVAVAIHSIQLRYSEAIFMHHMRDMLFMMGYDASTGPFSHRGGAAKARFLAKTIDDMSLLYSIDPRLPKKLPPLYFLCGIPVLKRLFGPSTRYDTSLLLCALSLVQEKD